MSEFSGHFADGFRLLCPNCRNHPLFRTFFAMHPNCPGCGYVFEREAGYFIGAIYINMAITLPTLVGGYYLLDWYAGPALSTQFIIWGLFSVSFPVLFFRYSRGVWINLDYYFTHPKAPGKRSAGEKK